MATTPTPRSFTQIMDDQLSTFLSKTSLSGIRIGSPLLSLFQSVAQSAIRTSGDIFQGLSSISLDRAEDDALDKIGASEDIPKPRQGATSASGMVNISDSSFVKIESVVWSGNGGASAGATIIFVDDASLFPATPFNIYLGRGTATSEGPLTVSAASDLGSYWQLTLSNPTTKYHNPSESVILAQGGDRVVDVGTTVRVPRGALSDSIVFSTTAKATILDGETLVQNINVVAQIPGKLGNAAAGSIKEFANPPFTGATVVNPKGFTNGSEIESNKVYRERIRLYRQSKSKGTAASIESNLLGVQSEDRRVSSVSVTSDSLNKISSVVIDDGNGFEPEYSGVAYEILESNASGGELYFQLLGNRPYSAAAVESVLSEPFNLTDTDILSVRVGNLYGNHQFSLSDFGNITAASGYEVATSINRNTNLPFKARTLNAGTKVVLEPRDTLDQEIEVISLAENDANVKLGFSAAPARSIWLYKNDVPLSAGKNADLTSRKRSQWSAFSGTQTLVLAIDGGPAVTYSITDADFNIAGLAYVSQTNSNAAWSKVLEYKIPGIYAIANDDSTITLRSKRGQSDLSALVISGGTLVSAGMFTLASVLGETADYVINRGTGQIRLRNALAVGDRLTAATEQNQAFVESAAITTLTGSGDLWLSVDGDLSLVDLTLGSGTVIGMTSTATAWGARVEFQDSTSSSKFANVKAGDWLLITNATYNANNQGAFRVAHMRQGGGSGYISIERAVAPTVQSLTVNETGFRVVRSNRDLIKVNIPSGTNYTASELASIINTALAGRATAVAYKTNKIRILSNKNLDGQICVLATTGIAASLGFTTPVVKNSDEVSHVGSAVSGLLKMPRSWALRSVNAAGTTSTFDTLVSAPELTRSILNFGQSAPDSANGYLRQSNRHYQSAVSSISGTTVTVSTPVQKEFVPSSSFREFTPWSFSPRDALAVVLDNDTSARRYNPNLFRRLRPVTSTYSIVQDLTDSDNTNFSLARAFGLSFSFADFAVHMKARAKASRTAGGADTTATVLYRAKRFGPEGNSYAIRYTLPTAPNTPVGVLVNLPIDTFTVPIDISLPSGATRTAPTLRNGSRVGVVVNPSGGNSRFSFIFGFPISTALRRVRVSYSGRNTTAFTGLVTGATSLATGTVVSDSLPGGFAGAGVIEMSGGSGIFIPGETITAGAASATTTSGSRGKTIATLDLTGTNATETGFSVGDKIWVQSTDINFSTGLKYIEELTATTVTYSEGVNTVVATATPGTVSADNTAVVDFTGSTVVVGDYFNISSLATIDANTKRSFRVNTIGTQFVTGLTETGFGTNTIPTWYTISDASYFRWFAPNTGAATASAIAASINALAFSPVEAVAVGAGGVSTGVVSVPWWEDTTTWSVWKNFADGINYVQSVVNPPNTSTDYTFTFKNPITAHLATNSDWANEELRIVPFTTKNAVEFLNSQATSGLSAAGMFKSSEQEDSLHLATTSVGALGSVYVQGGTANSVSFSLDGSITSFISGSMTRIDTDTSNLEGLVGGGIVQLKTTLPFTKNTFSAIATIDSITSAGLVTMAVGNPWLYATVSPADLTGRIWVTEKIGNFLSFRWVSFVGSGSDPTTELGPVSAGSWVQISNSGSAANDGLYKIVAINGANFVVENPNAEDVNLIVTPVLRFIQSGSILPGDEITIGNNTLGINNSGKWTVESIGPTQFQFKLLPTRALQIYTGPSAPVVGFLTVTQNTANTMYNRVVTIVPYSSTRAYLFLQPWFEEPSVNSDFTTFNLDSGAILAAMSKLNFSSSIFNGTDAYKEGTGLIAEASRVLYGDETDRSAYPGIGAEGADLLPDGGTIRPVKIGLAVRLASTANINSIFNTIKDVVIGTLLRAPVGRPLSISTIVSAVESVNGVTSVVVTSPVYNSAFDTISCQSFEKLAVINRNDIQITQLGE